MASPQPDKFTRFSNELLDKFLLVSAKMPASCNAVWLAIFRKTYGFNKKKDRISLSQLSEITDIETPGICRAIRRLKKEKMILNNNGFRGIQKDYEQWALLAIPPVAKQPVADLPDGNLASTPTGNPATGDPVATGNPANLLLAILPDTKDSIKDKENIKTKKKDNSEIEIEIAELKPQELSDLFNRLCPSRPKVRVIQTDTTRYKHIITQLKKHPKSVFWELIFKKVEDSEFLSGSNGKWTACNFDWILEPRNLIKIYEDTYANGKGQRGMSYAQEQEHDRQKRSRQGESGGAVSIGQILKEAKEQGNV